MQNLIAKVKATILSIVAKVKSLVMSAVVKVKAEAALVSKEVSKLVGYIKSPLPRGLAEFHKWADDIIHLYDLPENDSIKFTLATMVLHLESHLSSYPKALLANRVKKAMSNQVSAQVIQDLKAKQAAAQQQSSSEAQSSTQPQSASNDEQQQQSVQN